MKVRIELTDGSSEDEIVIRCHSVDSQTQKLVEQLLASSQSRLAFYRGGNRGVPLTKRRRPRTSMCTRIRLTRRTAASSGYRS